MKNIKQVEFHNIQNTKASFDLIKLEELFKRNDLGHSLEDHHKVQFYILILIENGTGSHTVDFIDYHYKKGSIFTIRKDQVHKFTIKPKVKGRLLLFTDEFLVSYLEQMEELKTTLLFNELLGQPNINLSSIDYQSIAEIIKRIENEYFSVNDEHSFSIIRSELHILITKLFRIKSKVGEINFEKKYLKEFVQLQMLVEKEAQNTNKVKDYAAMMGLSTKTLNTITKNIIHKPAKEFVDEILTKQIKRLIINNEQFTIKEVAYQSGFDETTNFYKYFKRQTGQTPEQFREQFS